MDGLLGKIYDHVIRELINHTALFSGENGFLVGVRFAVRLMGEICLSEELIVGER